MHYKTITGDGPPYETPIMDDGDKQCVCGGIITAEAMRFCDSMCDGCEDDFCADCLEMTEYGKLCVDCRDSGNYPLPTKSEAHLEELARRASISGSRGDLTNYLNARVADSSIK
jgi:hypothetical protein